jgi:hypothetical protein
MTDSKKKRKRYVYLDKFKSLEYSVQEHIENTDKRFISLYIILGVLIVTVGVLYAKVIIG